MLTYEKLYELRNKLDNAIQNHTSHLIVKDLIALSENRLCEQEAQDLLCDDLNDYHPQMLYCKAKGIQHEVYYRLVDKAVEMQDKLNFALNVVEAMKG